MFIVLAYRNACGDVEVFQVEKDGKDFWNTLDEARAVMKEEYETMSRVWTPDWSRSGRDLRKRRISRTSARFQVPVWDGERQRNGSITCKWRIVEIGRSH